MIGGVAETYRQRPSLFMSGVLQLSSSAFMWDTSSGLCRFRRQRIGAQICFLKDTVDVLVQGRETRFAARCVLLEICCGSSREGGTHEVRG